MNKNTASRNFVNKIWNAGNYVIEQLRVNRLKTHYQINFTIWDSWIVYCFNQTLEIVSNNIDGYCFNEAANAIYSFFWHDFCDWYIEISKSSPNLSLLRKVFANSLQLMHPIIPFITEAMWLLLSENEETSIMYSQWPHPISLSTSQLGEATKLVPNLQELIRSIRNVKSEFHLTGNKDLSIPYSCNDKNLKNAIDNNLINITKLTRIKDLYFVDTKQDQFIATTVNTNLTVFFPKNLIDITEEIKNKKVKIVKLDKELGALSKKLNNKNFMMHAPEDVVSEAKDAYAALETKKKLILSRIKDLTNN